ncbi:MAG: aspartate aminotransferase family protein [Bacteriovoracaceae bacterium]|nr:aspartate aminotransferase family protein [Bacteriovoracaceae bacterium]
MPKDYFYTWTKQNGATHIEIESSAEWTLKSPKGDSIADLTSISFQAGFGLSCPEIKSEIQKQLDTMPIASPKADFTLKSDMSKKLIESTGFEGKIFYTVSGAEANENALKIVREQRNCNTVCARSISYHGATLGALSVTGDWRNTSHETADDWTLRIPEPSDDPNATKTREIIENYDHTKIAAIILETFTGGNGAYSAPESYWRGIQSICDEYSIPLILDEVICGFYRTGEMYGFSHFDFLRPSFITLSKMITGGYIPFGAVFVSKEYADYYDDNILSCGLTNYAHPLGLAAMKGVFNLIEREDFHITRQENEKTLHQFCSDIESLKSVTETRCTGLLAAIDVTFQPDPNEFLSRGIYLLTPPNRVLLGPALNMDPEYLKKALSIVKEYLQENS